MRSRFWLYLGIVLLAAVGLRVAYVLTVTQYDDKLYDATYYTLEAVALAHGQGFVDPFAPFHNPPIAAGPSADHAPLTSLILVPAALLDDTYPSELLMRFTMVLVGLGSVVMVGLLARELGGDVVGLVAAGIAALDPNLWMNDGLIMSESLSILLVAAILLLAYRVLRGASLRWILALGALCGLLMLVRAELASLTLFVAVPAVWIGSRGRDLSSSKRIGRAVVCAAVAVVLVAPWVGYNLSRFEKPTFVSTNDGLTLLAANCDLSYYGPALGSGDLACTGPTPKGDPSVVNSVYRSRAFHYLRDHLGRWPVVVAARAARMWSLFRVPETVTLDQREGRPRWASYLGVAMLYVLMVTAIGGAIVARRRKVPVWPLVVPIVVVTSVTVLIGGIIRYRAVAEPSLIVLAAIGIGAVLDRRWGTRRGSTEPSGPDSDDASTDTATDVVTTI